MSENEWNGIVHEEVLSSRATPSDVSVVWKIKDISLYTFEKAIEIRSRKFYFSTAVWTLSLFPSGETIAKSSHIVLYLNCETPSTTIYDLKVKCLVADDSGVSLKSSEFTAEFKLKYFWGYSLVPNDDEKLSFLTKSNGLVIKYELHLNGMPEKQDSKLCKMQPELSNSDENVSEMLSEFSISDENCFFMKTFGGAFGNKEFSDIIVRVGGEEIPAHKIILASRSKVFREMLMNDMKEMKDGAIDLKEIDTSVAKEMLRFMYAENVQALSFDKTIELYVAADRYDLQGLRLKCRDFLMEHLSFDNVCDVIVVADSHLDDVLAVRSREYFSANFKKILQTEKWKWFENEKPQFCYNLVKATLEILI